MQFNHNLLPKILTLYLLLFLGGINLMIAQAPIRKSPYEWSYAADIPTSTIGIGANVAYIILDKKLPGLSPAEILSLDRNQVNSFDRSATYNWNPKAALASDILLYSSMALPAILLADADIRKDYLKVGSIYLQTLALNTGITNLTKVLVHRNRPYMYNPEAPMDLKLKNDARYSFFSGHTSVSAAMCFMTAKIYSDYHPDSKALPYIWAGAAIIPATTALLRWEAGKHYWSDVIVGYITGAAIGFLVPHLHKIVR